MSGIGPSDALWLAAHDGAGHARLIGDRPLGLGLATGLLAELVHCGWCQLWDGRLFRKEASPPADLVPRALLTQMMVDEQNWPPLPAEPDHWHPEAVLPPGTYVGAHAPRSPGHGRSPARHAVAETRPPGPGHDVAEWMSWLAYEGRAEGLVGDRLARLTLVMRDERRRLFGGTTVRYIPRDLNVTVYPASVITSSVRRDLKLSWEDLFVAGLLLATGLDKHALATLTQSDRSVLLAQLKGLDEESRALLRAADAAVGDAAIRST